MKGCGHQKEYTGSNRTFEKVLAVGSCGKKVLLGSRKFWVNMADYSEFVNYGHRVVSRSGKTTGFVPGNHMLEKGISYIDRRLMGLFKAEIERIRREHDG